MPLQELPSRLRRGLYVLLALLLPVIALPLFNFSSWADKLAQDASESLGRRVAVKAMRLALLPRPSVTLEGLTVSEPNGRSLFARFDNARFSLSWGALFGGQVEVVDARVEGLAANLYFLGEGRLNIDDLLTRRPKSQRLSWRPERVDLVDAALTWNDLHGQVTRFRKLDLHALDPEGDAGAITVLGQLTAPDWSGGLRVDSQIQVDRQRLTAHLQGFRLAIKAETPEWRDGNLELTGDLSAAALPWRGRLAHATVRASAQRGDQRWQTTIKSPEFRGGEGGLATGQIEADFGIKSSQRELAGQLKLARLAADPQGGLVADTAKLGLRLLDDTQNAVLDIESPLRIDDWRRISLEGFNLTGSYNHKALPSGAIKLELGGRTAVDLEKERFDWDSRGKLDGAAVTAQLSLENFLTPRYAFGLDLAKLDLTPYLPAVDNAPTLDPKQVLNWSWLDGLSARGDIKLGELDIGRFRVFNLQTHVEAGKRQVLLEPLAADIYGGQLKGRALLSGGKVPRLQLTQTLQGMEVAALMSDTFGIDRLSGRGNLNVDVNAPAISIDALRRGLAGRVDVMLSRGEIAGLDVGDMLRGLRNNLAKLTGDLVKVETGRGTRFSDLSARFVLKDGVAESRDLQIRAPFVALEGGGKLDIGRGELDYLLNATVRGGSGLPELDALKGVVVPIQIAGPLNAPAYRVDTRALREKLSAPAKGGK
ncbi:AsmA family protein [Chitinimonas sp.]|uniref:AsmA family protein n=1 Tax=Chitinimonas sp. TaxID=1934313 RepID=UPI002F92617A